MIPSARITARFLRPIRKSIAWQLVLGLGAVVLTMGAVSTISTLWFATLAQRINAAEQDECKARGVAQLAGALRDQSAHAKSTLITEDLAHEDAFREAAREVKTRADLVRALPGLPQSAQSVEEIVVASEKLERLYRTRVLPLVRAGDRAALRDLDDQILGFAATARQIHALAHAQEEEKEELSRSVRRQQSRAVLVSLLAQLAAFAMALATGTFLYRSFARPIATLSAGTARVAAGDLETAIDVDREDGLGQLARSFNEMMQAIKDNQSKLLQAERLAGLGRMAATIAHEINNPIGVILGYARLHRHRNGPHSDMLASIEEEAERCHQVVEGLLDLSRNSVHKIRSTIVDLRLLADQVAASSWLAGRAAGVAIEVTGSGATIGDETKLRQVLVNVLTNAVESCGLAGRVTVIIEPSPPTSVRVVVTDSGPGVEPSAHERIFDPFFTTKQHGTGLGLAISRAIARAHGGDLTLDADRAPGTVRNPGATFVLILRAAGCSS